MHIVPYRASENEKFVFLKKYSYPGRKDTCIQTHTHSVLFCAYNKNAIDGDFNAEHLFIICLLPEYCNSKVKVLLPLLSDRSPFSDLKIIIFFSLCLDMLGKRLRCLSSIFPLKVLITLKRAANAGPEQLVLGTQEESIDIR